MLLYVRIFNWAHSVEHSKIESSFYKETVANEFSLALFPAFYVRGGKVLSLVLLYILVRYNATVSSNNSQESDIWDARFWQSLFSRFHSSASASGELGPCLTTVPMASIQILRRVLCSAVTRADTAPNDSVVSQREVQGLVRSLLKQWRTPHSISLY